MKIQVILKSNKLSKRSFDLNIEDKIYSVEELLQVINQKISYSPQWGLVSEKLFQNKIEVQGEVDFSKTVLFTYELFFTEVS